MIADLFQKSSVLLVVVAFCALCLVVVLMLVVSVVADWVKLRRTEREDRKQWAWEKAMGIIDPETDFDEWRRNPYQGQTLNDRRARR